MIIQDFITSLAAPKASLSACSVSVKAEFRYLKALNYLESDNYEEALMEPVIIPSNVKGGLGFVGISSETRMTMQLPDEIIDNENLPPYTQ